MISSSFEFARSQDLPELYHDAGQFYWGSKAAWKSETPIFTGNSSVTILGKWETIDVDTLEDWNIVEGLLSLRSK
jgi:N-acylneuraminate cytidylyltransferase